MTEMMIHLAVLASQIRPHVTAVPDIKLETEVNLRPRDNLFLNLIPVG